MNGQVGSALLISLRGRLLGFWFVGEDLVFGFLVCRIVVEIGSISGSDYLV